MIVLWILAGLFLLYYVITLAGAGLTAFSLIWLIGSIVFFGWGFSLLKLRAAGIFMPRWLKISAAGIFILLLGVFIYVESLIIRCGMMAPEPDADYVIVLGAQVKGKAPSKILDLRIKTAAEYLKNNPDTKVIVSGGQGSGEEISEAECMKRRLIELGIEQSRIYKEDKSTNTQENLSYSLNISGRDKKIVIVTCNFHMYRAQAIAKKLGAKEVSGSSSPSDAPLLINYYAREFFAVFKYMLSGQI